MTARAVRIIVIVVCGGGVAGMIVSSILDHNGAAITFGLVTAVAVLCLMVATAVSAGGPNNTASSPGPNHPGGPVDADQTASALEDAIGDLVASGADEAAVRDIVREAVRLGRQQSDPRRPP